MPGIDLEAIETADIVHLHGVNGAVNISSLGRLDPATRVVWTLHDMNSFTGVCHYSLGCSNFTQQCSECPAVRKAFQDPVKRSLQRKIVGVSNIKNLSLVAPSSWLAEQARRSSVLKKRAITTIANPVDPIFVSHESARTHRRNPRQVRAIIAAQNLSDPVKQVELGIKGFLSALRTSDLATLTLVGRGGEHFKGPNIVLKGVLTTEELAREFEEADVLIVPSRAENSPLVIAEASALGCYPMVTDAGGMPSMVSDLDHGAVFSTAESLAQELHEFSALSLEVRKSIREKIGQRARELFSPASVVEHYDKVYAGA